MTVMLLAGVHCWYCNSRVARHICSQRATHCTRVLLYSLGAAAPPSNFWLQPCHRRNCVAIVYVGWLESATCTSATAFTAQGGMAAAGCPPSPISPGDEPDCDDEALRVRLVASLKQPDVQKFLETLLSQSQAASVDTRPSSTQIANACPRNEPPAKKHKTDSPTAVGKWRQKAESLAKLVLERKHDAARVMAKQLYAGKLGPLK